MTTVKNQARRAAETREERRVRLADPAAANSVEDSRERQMCNGVLQSNKAMARALELKNRQAELEADVKKLYGMKERALRGYTGATRAAYDRIYERIDKRSGLLAASFGVTFAVPVYDPPVDSISRATRIVGPEAVK